jgi:hypothetical protein
MPRLISLILLASVTAFGLGSTAALADSAQHCDGTFTQDSGEKTCTTSPGGSTSPPAQSSTSTSGKGTFAKGECDGPGGSTAKCPNTSK